MWLVMVNVMYNQQSQIVVLADPVVIHPVVTCVDSLILFLHRLERP